MDFLTIIVKMSLTHLEINHFYYLFYAKVNFVKGFGRQDHLDRFHTGLHW